MAARTVNKDKVSRYKVAPSPAMEMRRKKGKEESEVGGTANPDAIIIAAGTEKDGISNHSATKEEKGN